MKLIKKIIFGILIFSSWVIIACNKEEFLAKKPNTGLIVPQSIDDCQKLLDTYSIMNGVGDLTEASSDDYYLQDFDSWQGLTTTYRNAYLWKEDIYEGKNSISDWDDLYTQILYANVVIETINSLNQDDDSNGLKEVVKGAALFFRGYAFFNLAQAFCLPYSEAADHDLGIPLKITADVNVTEPRSSLSTTYNQIITDISESSSLLPEIVDYNHPNRPSKPAAFALMSRLFLVMHNYEKALLYADSCLNLYDALMDYNSAFISFERKNEELLFQSELGLGNDLFQSYFYPYTIVDSSLYSLYDDNDLRKDRYFRYNGGFVKRNMSYTGTVNGFSGLAIDEIYLIKAECLARTGDYIAALRMLNFLLEKRYITGTFVPIESENKDEALSIILGERRKELCFRGLRWQDIRRLNTEGYNIVLTKLLNGQAYTLEPNSKRYALPIPEDEIRFSGNMQNDRSN